MLIHEFAYSLFIGLRLVMYQSIPSLTIPPFDPRGFALSHYLEGRVFAQLSLPGGLGFKIREIFCSFDRAMQEFLDLFQRNWRQLEKQAFVCCFKSIFVKVVDVCCTFNNIDHFRSFRSLSNHPRVTLLM